MQDPRAATVELERAMTELKFCGALINGHTDGRYLDDPSYAEFLATAERLGAPIYIHPTDPPPAVVDAWFRGYPELVTGGWGWQAETGTHVLRLICAGVFDRHPDLKVIVGHMGELLPYTLGRLNKGLTLGSWLLSTRDDTVPRMQRNLRSYLRSNVFITTSGVFDQAALQCALAEVGIDNLLFSVDDPFADNVEAVSFLCGTRLGHEDREKLAYRNAESLLRLGDLALVTTTATPGSWSRMAATWRGFAARLKARTAKKVLSFLVG